MKPAIYFTLEVVDPDPVGSEKGQLRHGSSFMKGRERNG
jgi:hypothetical protein